MSVGGGQSVFLTSTPRLIEEWSRVFMGADAHPGG
jgi:hypothetical protein